jgi:hypothetical protein
MRPKLLALEGALVARVELGGGGGMREQKGPCADFPALQLKTSGSQAKSGFALTAAQRDV